VVNDVILRDTLGDVTIQLKLKKRVVYFTGFKVVYVGPVAVYNFIEFLPIYYPL
jgi:hypothetical protein